MAKRLLLVDDDTLMRRSLSLSLGKAGYDVDTAANAEDALAISQRETPDLVLLDIGLPGMDGLEALRRFREHFHVPVILLTARRRDIDQVLGLELGADDYVTKPFDFDVLLARVRSVLRRAKGSAEEAASPAPLQVGDLAIDPGAHVVSVAGSRVELPPREFDLLYTLALSAGRVVSVDDLLSRVWGAEYEHQPDLVYVHVRWLREKLETEPNHPQRVVTIRGVGYKLEPRNTQC
jgi:DNA-binding response OmpR family regulator